MKRCVAAALAALSLPTTLPAQPGQPNWIVQRTERGTVLATTVTGTPEVQSLAVMCLNTSRVPMVLVHLPRHRPGEHISLILRGGNNQVGWLDTGWERQGNSQYWGKRLSDGQFVDVLAGPDAALNVSFNGRPNGRLSMAGSSRALTEALAACWQPRAAAAAQGNVSGFTLDIVLSSRAAAELQRRNEGITVSTFYSGMPRPAYARHADETSGELDMGQHEMTVPGRAGPVTVPETALNRRRLSWITGAPEVLVNVYSARRSSQDNLLACGTVQGSLPAVAGRNHRILCTLIGER
ncbi:MAG TPA: hypothetical protein VMG08_18640 [Allosphingosinicella sp.]|nr:hypothetical protein [Allosphingosinicella sp.]